MAIVAASADQAAELLQKLSLDSQTKTLEIPEPTKKPSGNQFGVVDGGDATNGQNQSYERSVTPLLQEFMDPSMCYVPNGYSSYYYGGYDGTTNEWEDYSRYMNLEGVEMSAGVYGDNGSFIYHHGYGYAPYSPYPLVGSQFQLLDVMVIYMGLNTTSVQPHALYHLHLPPRAPTHAWPPLAYNPNHYTSSLLFLSSYFDIKV